MYEWFSIDGLTRVICKCRFATGRTARTADFNLLKRAFGTFGLLSSLTADDSWSPWQPMGTDEVVFCSCVR